MRIVRIKLQYYAERKIFGLWIKTDRRFRVLSFRPAFGFKDTKVLKAAYELAVENPKEVIEYLD